jgi:hypothetical protein
MEGTIRILMADDYAAVQKRLRALIATKPGLELVAESRECRQGPGHVSGKVIITVR